MYWLWNPQYQKAGNSTIIGEAKELLHGTCKVSQQYAPVTPKGQERLGTTTTTTTQQQPMRHDVHHGDVP